MFFCLVSLFLSRRQRPRYIFSICTISGGIVRSHYISCVKSDQLFTTQRDPAVAALARVENFDPQGSKCSDGLLCASGQARLDRQVEVEEKAGSFPDGLEIHFLTLEAG